MTAKAKAKELLEKMNIVHYMKLTGENSNSKGLPISMYDSQIKQCALNCVDQIIKSMPTNPLKNSYIMLYSEMVDECVEYWQQVKTEIEKL